MFGKQREPYEHCGNAGLRGLLRIHAGHRRRGDLQKVHLEGDNKRGGATVENSPRDRFAIHGTSAKQRQKERERIREKCGRNACGRFWLKFAHNCSSHHRKCPQSIPQSSFFHEKIKVSSLLLLLIRKKSLFLCRIIEEAIRKAHFSTLQTESSAKSLPAMSNRNIRPRRDARVAEEARLESV